jgi:hypothetical protein
MTDETVMIVGFNAPPPHIMLRLADTQTSCTPVSLLYAHETSPYTACNHTQWSPNWWSTALHDKLIVYNLSKRLIERYGTWQSITVFTIVRHMCLPSAIWVQYKTSNAISLKSISILSNRIRLWPPNATLCSSRPRQQICLHQPSHFVHS